MARIDHFYRLCLDTLPNGLGESMEPFHHKDSLQHLSTHDLPLKGGAKDGGRLVLIGDIW